MGDTTVDRGTVVMDTRQSHMARLHPIPLQDVALEDAFWSPRLHTVRNVTLPGQYDQCERSGRIDNFRRAAGKKEVPFQGRFYNDSDVYKWLEAACYALATSHDDAVAKTVADLVADIADAQEPDGYLNTYFTFDLAPLRYTDLVQKHELYCAGHLIQAAVAHHRATGQPDLLAVAERLARHICAIFGPRARSGTDGHEEIELALVELYRETGNATYLHTAGFFLDQRGKQPPVLNGSLYLQDHLPVREQHEIVGHAVRATYLLCGMVDVYMETGDASLWDAAERLWRSAYERKQYLTGGLGARYEGEAFGADYELPNDRAYAETCAAIGSVMWNWRMLACTGDARFADSMETALYNGVLSGLSLDGQSYFYQNPLADRGHHRRQPWFATACCPPNISRLLLSFPSYIASTSEDGCWLHLYVSGHIRTTVPGGALSMRISSDYPWDGIVRVTIEEAPAGDTSLHLRIPGWCHGATVRVNGDPQETPRSGTYLRLERSWRRADLVELDLPMPVRTVMSHPHVLANVGRVALMRGPLVYCLEGVDHPGVDVWDLALAHGNAISVSKEPDLLEGVVALRGEALLMDSAAADQPLYLTATTSDGARRPHVSFTAIPYYAWANREAGPMQVWMRDQPSPR